MKLKDRVFILKRFNNSLWLMGACTYEFWQEINQKINARNKYYDTLLWNESIEEIEYDIINSSTLDKLRYLLEEK